MIRLVSGLFLFAVALCAYIVMKPASNPGARAAVTLEDITAVTRAQTQSLIADVPLPTGNIDASTSEMLAQLGLNTNIAVPNLPTEAAAVTPMDDATASILSGISAVTNQQLTITPTPVAAPAPVTAASTFESLVMQALQEGQTDDFIHDLVNQAAQSGTISVPQILVTADGHVDTDALLGSLLTQVSGAAPAMPVVASGQGTGVEVIMEQGQQRRYYTVSSGDSLGGIAVKFYGNVNKFDLIFSANRDVLSSPDRIQVGQRLSIPTI